MSDANTNGTSLTIDTRLITTTPDTTAEINEKHRAIKAHGDNMVQLAIDIGELLIAEKKRLDAHGQWQDWVKTHYEFSHDVAINYMRVARNKTSALGFSSLRRVLAYLYEEKHGEAPPSEKKKAAKARRKADPDPELEALPPAQRKLVKQIIRNHDLVRIKKFNSDLAAAVKKAVRERTRELDRREADLDVREAALKAHEEKLWQLGRASARPVQAKVITRRRKVQHLMVTRVTKGRRAGHRRQK